MRFCCIVAMIILGILSWSPHPNSALAQPYQKNWQHASQPGAGNYQKHLGIPPDSACQPYCQGKCYPPCEPDQPKDAVPDQPRSAVPGVAPGVFVAPPQSGVVEGPSRGFEIGNVSLTLPEITLGLPRLRWEGVKRLSRDARLMTDRAAAPYAANPYYAAAMAELQARESARDAVKATDDSDRSAKKDAQPEKDRGAEQKSCDSEPGNKGTTPTDVEQRLQSLENAVRLQMETLQDCIEELKTQRSGAGGYPRAPVIVPVPAPCDAGKGAADVRFHPDRFPPAEAVEKLGQAPSRPLIFQGFRGFGSEPVPFLHSLAAPGTAFAPDVRPANYQVLMPVETTASPDSLRRLPPVTQVPDR